MKPKSDALRSKPVAAVLAVVASIALAGVAVPKAGATDTILYSFVYHPSVPLNDSITLSNDGSQLYANISDNTNTEFGCVSIPSSGAPAGSLGGWIQTPNVPVGSLTLSGSTLFGMDRYMVPHGIGGAGEIFSINAISFSFATVLHTFSSVSDGSNPSGSPVLSGSILYGSAYTGGAYNDGTIYSMSTDGSAFETLYNFTGGSSDGVFPSPLSLSGSNLYGTSSAGLFSISTSGGAINLLNSFTGKITMSGSKIYGVLSSGGANSQGGIYSMNLDGGDLALLHSFNGLDGSFPNQLTVFGSTIFGATNQGGAANDGTAYEMNTDGSDFRQLHTFTGGTTDGINPTGSLTLSQDGSLLYGMTTYGGAGSCGTVFSVPTGVPEPSSLALIGIGLCPLLMRRVRRQAMRGGN